MTDARRRSDCRLCGSANLAQVLSLTPTPLANAFRPPDVPAAAQSAYPLDLYLCADCGHLQLGHVVDPGILFSEYVYVSGTSPVFVRHFEDYADDMLRRLPTGAPPRVFEIGSNDGTFLKAFQTRGATVLGVDPARKIAAAADAAGVPTLSGFFDAAMAETARARLGAADIVVANNVCAHIDDLAGVVTAVAGLLAPDGLFAFEVSYRKDVLDGTLFDTIYHEHLDYHAVRPLAGFLARCGLHMIDVVRVPTHGGSVRVVAAKAGSAHRPTDAVAAAIAAEEEAAMFDAATYGAFGETIQHAGAALRGVLAEASSAGRRVAGYGAPAKATTLMHHFGLGGNALCYVVDDSPWKQGLMCPGFDLEVVPSQRLQDDPADDILVLAWNFADPIIERARPLLKPGARAIVPLPQLDIRTLS